MEPGVFGNGDGELNIPGQQQRSATVRRPHLKTATAAIPSVGTAHNSGTKKVLSRGFDQPVLIKQVAVGTLLPGEAVEPHSHPDLDEYYYVLNGEGTMRVDEEIYKLAAGDFIIVTAGSEHELRSDDKTLEFYYQSFEVISG